MAGIWETIVGVSPWIIGPLIPLILGGNNIICKSAFQKGMRVVVFLFYKNVLASIILAVAALVTRTERPPLGLIGVFRVTHLAILEPLVSQFCVFTGLRFTAAGFTSSLVACGPAFTFLAACFLGMEYVHWTARSFRAKLLGMILMVSGGCIVGFYHGSSISIMHSHTGSRIGRTARELVEDWFRGPVLLLVALAASVWYNLQIKKVAQQYGSDIWLNCYISTAGALMTLFVALGVEARSSVAWILIADIRLVSYIYSGVFVSGLASFLQITLTRMRDPVFVAAFSPISLVFGMLMTLVVVRDVIHLGGILGVICIIVGLLVLLWGKAHDPTPPLLPVQEVASAQPQPSQLSPSPDPREPGAEAQQSPPVLRESEGTELTERGEPTPPLLPVQELASAQPQPSQLSPSPDPREPGAEAQQSPPVLRESEGTELTERGEPTPPLLPVQELASAQPQPSQPSPSPDLREPGAEAQQSPPVLRESEGTELTERGEPTPPLLPVQEVASGQPQPSQPSPSLDSREPGAEAQQSPPVLRESEGTG